MSRREMTHLMESEDEARQRLSRIKDLHIWYPPMLPITDIRVERRLIKDDMRPYRWVVTGDYSAWE